jgi:hypothetical protein
MKFILLSALFVIASFSTICASTYADRHLAFSGKEPAPELKVLMNTQLVDFSIDAKSFISAMDSLVAEVQRVSKVGGLSMIIRSPDNHAYKQRIRIEQKTMKLSDAIDIMCHQAGVTWDFSGIKLTIKPKK